MVPRQESPRPGDPCRLCKAKLTLYSYPRPGPAPGFMVVCSNDECDHSLAAMQRLMREQVRFRQPLPEPPVDIEGSS